MPDDAPSFITRPMIIRLAVFAAVFAAVNPWLAARVAYAVGGVGLGFGSTKLLKFAASPKAKDRLMALASQLNFRARLRAFLLRMDPSLADDQDKTVTLKDLAPLRPFKGKKKGGGMPPPPWAKPATS